MVVGQNGSTFLFKINFFAEDASQLLTKLLDCKEDIYDGEFSDENDDNNDADQDLGVEVGPEPEETQHRSSDLREDITEAEQLVESSSYSTITEASNFEGRGKRKKIPSCKLRDQIQPPSTKGKGRGKRSTALVNEPVTKRGRGACALSLPSSSSSVQVRCVIFPVFLQNSITLS